MVRIVRKNKKRFSPCCIQATDVNSGFIQRKKHVPRGVKSEGVNYKEGCGGSRVGGGLSGTICNSGSSVGKQGLDSVLDLPLFGQAVEMPLAQFTRLLQG